MAITLSRDINGTGIAATHWVLTSMAVHRTGTSNSFDLDGTYRAWRDQAAFDEGMEPVPGLRARVLIPGLPGNPTLGNLQQQLDAAIVQAGADLAGGTVL